MAKDMYKLLSLQPNFREKVKKVVLGMEKRGLHIRIVWGMRTYEENLKLYKQGLASLTSKHLSGKACDLIDRKLGYSIKSKHHKFYTDLSELAKQEGLIWGGNFSTRWDPCHIEIK